MKKRVVQTKRPKPKFVLSGLWRTLMIGVTRIHTNTLCVCLRASEPSSRELPDKSDLRPHAPRQLPNPRGSLAKPTAGTAQLLSDDGTDLLFIIHASRVPTIQT
ncbi:unnamed protein product [Pleuronectes platessa]|uniref:Uncharacterized protein n=1 Tax=Pleuronectes platessa TaxID=8262 RepID=A0A9N7UEE8_PLEPL|nr:unnamed protein product [Pleuronectes platessa]